MSMRDNLGVKVSISDVHRDKVLNDIEKLLKRLNAPELNSGERQTLFEQYPQRYFERLLWLIIRIRPSCQQSHAAGTVGLTDHLRNDINTVLALVNETSLTDDEWIENLIPFCNWHWGFVSSLVGGIRGDQHWRAVDALIERERLRDERFKDYGFEIGWEYVKQHCWDRDIVLSDDEVEELFCRIPEQYDTFEVVANAIDALNDGAGPACKREACSPA